MVSKGVATVRAVGQSVMFLASSESQHKGHPFAGVNSQDGLTPAIPSLCSSPIPAKEPLEMASSLQETATRKQQCFPNWGLKISHRGVTTFRVKGGQGTGILGIPYIFGQRSCIFSKNLLKRKRSA